MDFASKYMASKGWTSGDGLGKHLHGRKDPVKVKYKFDINGLGHDKAETDKYKWWERAFQSAADAIEVGKDNKISKIEGKEAIVSTSRPMSKSMNRALLYGSHFVKAGVMSGGKFTREESDSDSDSSSDDEGGKGRIVEVTDEALFAACGGMTGHKGARHGINMTAKLARVKEQERIGLEKMKSMYKKSEDASKEAAKLKDEELSATLRKSASKISSKKTRKFEEPGMESNIPAKRVKLDVENNEEPQISVKPKKKKKKNQREISPPVEEEVVEEIVEKKEKKKTSKKHRIEEVVEEVNSELKEISIKKKKKKSKKKPCEGEETEDTLETQEDQTPKKSKKKKKDKKKGEKLEIEVEEESTSTKKKKKKRKKENDPE